MAAHGPQGCICAPKQKKWHHEKVTWPDFCDINNAASPLSLHQQSIIIRYFFYLYLFFLLTSYIGLSITTNDTDSMGLNDATRRLGPGMFILLHSLSKYVHRLTYHYEARRITEGNGIAWGGKWAQTTWHVVWALVCFISYVLVLFTDILDWS